MRDWTAWQIGLYKTGHGRLQNTLFAASAHSQQYSMQNRLIPSALYRPVVRQIVFRIVLSAKNHSIPCLRFQTV